MLCLQVVTLGFVDPEDIPRYLSCMDVYVCPSMRETYGISVVQAMAMGLPVIHYGVDGIQVGSLALRSRCMQPADSTLASTLLQPRVLLQPYSPSHAHSPLCCRRDTDS